MCMPGLSHPYTVAMMEGKEGLCMSESTRGSDQKLPVWEPEDLASASECTGLTPAAIQTPEEAENYAELYDIHEQKTAWKKETNGKPAPRKEQ